MLHSNNDTLSFEDVKANLLSKEQFDLEVRVKKGEGLSVRGELFDKGRTPKSKFKKHKSNESCRSFRKSGHIMYECFKLENKR